VAPSASPQASLPALIELGHPEALWIVDLGEKHQRLWPEEPELLRMLRNAAFDYVVSEVHDEIVIAEEFLSHKDCMSKALGLSLVDELDIGIPLGRAYGIYYLVPVRPCDYANLSRSGLDYILDRIEEDGLVGHRD